MIGQRSEIGLWWFVALAVVAHGVILYYYTNPPVKPFKARPEPSRIRVNLRSFRAPTARIMEPRPLETPPRVLPSPVPPLKSLDRAKAPPRTKPLRVATRSWRPAPAPPMRSVLLEAPEVPKKAPPAPARIQEAAPARPLAREAAPSPQPAPHKEDIASRYLARVRALIARKRRYPLMARRARQEGMVKIRFRILKKGALDGKPRLVASSGYPVLDRAALDCVRRAAPFPPIPRELGSSSLTLTLVIDFQLKE